MFLFDALVNLLPPRWRPYAKACWPSIASIVAVGVLWVNTGEFDRSELTVAVTGLSSALFTLALPNKAKRE